MTQEQKTSPDTVATTPKTEDKDKMAAQNGVEKEEKSGSCGTKGGCGCG
jgi:hypothetical protein